MIGTYPLLIASRCPYPQQLVRLAFRTLTIHSRTAILDLVSAGVAQW
jgi:hypothetical protein